MRLTCDGLGVPRTLSSRKKYDVSLVGADIIALEKVEPVDSIVLKRGNFDDCPDWPGEVLLNHEILLPLDLWGDR